MIAIDSISPLPPGPLTRRQLHEPVWSIPRMHLAARFGVSDVALGKICRRSFPPAPPNGWWTKVRMGTAPPRTELPEGLDPDEVVYVITEMPAPEPVIPLDPDVAAALAALHAAGPIVVSADLASPHPITAETLRWLDPKEARKRERIPCNSVERPAPCPAWLGLADATRDHALRVLEALFKAFGACGFETSVRVDDPSRRASTLILGESFSFRVRAHARTNALVLELFTKLWSYSYREDGFVRRWTDRKRAKVEDRLAEIVRAGVSSVRAGQTRAALALGMSGAQVVRRIVLPQAIVRMLPAFGSILSVTIKDTAIATVIAVPELMRQSETIAGQSFRPMEVFTFAMIVYFLLLFPVTRGVDMLYARVQHLGRS